MNRIKELRINRSLTLKELSTEICKNFDIKISDGQLSNYENGKRMPRNPQIWEKLADYFDVSTPYLMGYSEIKEKLASKVLDKDSWSKVNNYDFSMLSYDNFKKLYSETLITATDLNIAPEYFVNPVFSVINSLNLVISNESDHKIYMPILEAYSEIQDNLFELISMYSSNPTPVDEFVDNEMYTLKFLETKEDINKSLNTIFKKTFLEDLD